jgi:hypothetical protein
MKVADKKVYFYGLSLEDINIARQLSAMKCGDGPFY